MKAPASAAPALSDDANAPMAMMPMTFSTALPINVLFASWVVQTQQDMCVACVAVAALGMSRRALLLLRAELAAANAGAPAPAPDDEDDGAGAGAGVGAGANDKPLLAHSRAGAGARGGLLFSALRRALPAALRPRRSLLALAPLQRSPLALRLAVALTFALGSALGYLNMLVAMTFNPFLLAALVVGEAAGVLLLEPLPGAGAGAGDDCH